MLSDLLFGFPGQRPGGLMLTLLLAIGSAFCALLLGAAYAIVCIQAPILGTLLQGALALVRGVPLLLLAFGLAQTTALPLLGAGFLALLVYSSCHVGETLRSFLLAYPTAARDQAQIFAMNPVRELVVFRLPWALRRSLEALGTHWISLLKDTGALTVLGIGELTTEAHVLSEQADTRSWALILATAAVLYLISAVALMGAIRYVQARFSLQEGTSP